jgi:membrane protein required for beta-lactamase induction
MSLLTILISLVLERFLSPLEHVRGLGRFGGFSNWLCTRFKPSFTWGGIFALALAILIPVALVGILQTLFADIFELLAFVFGIVVLNFALGPNNPLYLAHQYQHALEQGDEEKAENLLAHLLPEGVPADTEEQAQTLVNNILIQTHERMLAILFWFVILGPMGAILYMLAAYLAYHARHDTDIENQPANKGDFNQAAAQLHNILGWIPCRITALCYAIMGSFVHALHGWDTHPATNAGDSAMPANAASHKLLLGVGLGALQLDDEPPRDTHVVKEAFALCMRSVIAWLVVLALLTLAGWLA